jgi:hypothetical protein
MAVRFGRVWFGVAVGGWVLAAVAGCGSSALTNAPSNTPVNTEPASAAPSAGATPGPGTAVLNAITKLDLISQDSCQTGPPDQVYPNCDRFLAELRSAGNTVRNGAAGLPRSAEVAATSSGLLAATDAFDRDGCGGGPYASSADNAPTCTADLGRVRAALSTLIEQTKGSAGS